MIDISLDWVQGIAIALGIVFPLLVALVTKRVTSSAVKGLLLAGISVAAGLLAEISTALTTGSTFNVVDWLTVTIAALVAGQATYSSVWKPTGVAQRLQGGDPDYEHSL